MADTRSPIAIIDDEQSVRVALCKPIDADILLGAIQRAVGSGHVTAETRSA